MPRDVAQEINSIFRDHLVLNMGSIQKLIPNRSRISIFRDLRTAGYLSSYNLAGQYYTLIGIPQFDESGLWNYTGAFFSINGSLKNTARLMVAESEAGFTHDELREKLGIRLQNTLRDLVSAELIARQEIDGVYVYMSTDPAKSASQITRRAARLPADPYVTIEILRAVIKTPDLTPSEICTALRSGGADISLRQIVAVFGYYDLGKKNSL
jgi:hypothetical protein